jgi:hypothetical protein
MHRLLGTHVLYAQGAPGMNNNIFEALGYMSVVASSVRRRGLDIRYADTAWRRRWTSVYPTEVGPTVPERSGHRPFCPG